MKVDSQKGTVGSLYLKFDFSDRGPVFSRKYCIWLFGNAKADSWRKNGQNPIFD